MIFTKPVYTALRAPTLSLVVIEYVFGVVLNGITYIMILVVFVVGTTQTGDVERLEARLEVHQREVESKANEISALTSTVLELREQLASSVQVGDSSTCWGLDLVSHTSSLVAHLLSFDLDRRPNELSTTAMNQTRDCDSKVALTKSARKL